MKRVTKRGERPAPPKKRPTARHISRPKNGSANRAPKAGKDLLTAARDGLEGYAERGVITRCQEIEAGPGKTSFRFIWLYDVTMELVVDPPKRELRMNRLLGALPARSELYLNLKQFVDDLQTDKVP